MILLLKPPKIRTATVFNEEKEQSKGMVINSFDELISGLRKSGPKTIAVAVAHDRDVLQSVEMAREKGIANSILVGDKEAIKKIADGCKIDLNNFEIVDKPVIEEACATAVSLVRSGDALLPMKGFVDTSVILKAVLNKENGLNVGGLISHISVFKPSGYDRMMLLTDSAMNIAPNCADKAKIIDNAVKVANALGMARPIVAVVCAVEKVNPKMQATLDAEELVKMNESGAISGCSVVGPLGLDNAVSVEAAVHKGIKHPDAGKADILLMPDIEAGNILTKAIDFFAHAEKGGLIMGAGCPIILTSRASSDVIKLNSIALGLLAAEKGV